MADGRVILLVELWFESEPQLDLDALVAAVPGADRVASFRPERNRGKRPDTTQTWDWPDADAVLARCTHRLLIAEYDGRGHPYKDRIEAYLPTLRAAVELTQPVAAVCPTSDRVVRPSELIDDELAPFVNVRMFRVKDVTLMDTLGLHAFGLPDVQCRFDPIQHEPNAIGAMLYGLAAYLLDRGDVIADGDTVGDLPWRCHVNESLVAPERRVLDLIPA